MAYHAKTVADDILWGLADHEGSIRQIIDNSGTILERRDYDVFGEMTVTGTNDLLDEFAQSYTGRPWDADLELYQNRARWYDPVMGRFISVDPSGFDGGDANLYRYCNNSAINYNDPSGLCYTGSFNTGSSFSSNLWDTFDSGLYASDPYTNIFGNTGNAFNVSANSNSYTISHSNSYATSNSLLNEISALATPSSSSTSLANIYQQSFSNSVDNSWGDFLAVPNDFQSSPSINFQEKSYAIMSGGSDAERLEASKHQTGSKTLIGTGSYTYSYYKDLEYTGREPGLGEKIYWSIVSTIIPSTPPKIQKTYSDGSRITLVRNEPTVADSMGQAGMVVSFGGGILKSGATGLMRAGAEEAIDTTFTTVTGSPFGPSGLSGGGKTTTQKTVDNFSSSSYDTFSHTGTRIVSQSDTLTNKPLRGMYRGRMINVEANKINVRKGTPNVTGSGLEYAWKRHGGTVANSKSQFTITQSELKEVLQRKDVIKSPIRQSGTTGNYIRQVDVGQKIGNIAANKGGASTSVITVITDVKGNLINTFPGTLGRKATLQ